MTQVAVSAPGLYVRGRETAGRPALPTAVTGLVGLTERGPLHVPQPLRGFGEYEEVFGGFVPWGRLAESVYAFFQNGGEKCFVVRVAGPDPDGDPSGCPSVETLRAASATNLVDVDGADTIQVTAINEGLWGNGVTFAAAGASTRDLALTSLRTAAGSTDTVLQVDSVLDVVAGETIGVASATDRRVSGRYRVQSVDRISRRLTLEGQTEEDFPLGSVVSGKGFRLEARYGSELEVFDQLSMSPDNPRYFLGVVNGDDHQDQYVTRREFGLSILLEVADVSGAAKPLTTAATHFAGGGDGLRNAWVEVPSTGPGTMRLGVRSERGTAGHELEIDVEPFETITALHVPPIPTDPRTRVVVEHAEDFDIGDDLTLSIPLSDGTTFSQTRPIVGKDLQNGLVVFPAFGTDFPVGAAATVVDRFDLCVRRRGEVEPVEPPAGSANPLRNLSGDPAHARWYVTRVTNHSALLCAAPPGGSLDPEHVTLSFSGALDPGEVDYRYYTGYDPDGSQFSAAALGLARLESEVEVRLVAIPDLDRANPGSFPQGHADLLHHCATVDGRLALLDAPTEATLKSIETWSLQFPDDRLAKYGALYFPRLSGMFGGEARDVPPCGYVAGQIASSDRRRGVGKAPANDPWIGVVDLTVPVDAKDQELLNPAGVNCVRKFDDGEVRLFAARTLSRNTNHVHLNVRRVVLSVIEDLRQNLLWAVFEPNGSQLQRRVTSALESYLSSLTAKGLTASSRPEEAFYVRCNEENNSSETEDQGLLIAEIGLAVAAPAEFLVLTAKRTADAIDVVEEDR